VVVRQGCQAAVQARAPDWAAGAAGGALRIATERCGGGTMAHPALHPGWERVCPKQAALARSHAHHAACGAGARGAAAAAQGSWAVGGALWIAMEYCGGGSVADLVHAADAPLGEDVVAYICAEALAGLAYLHALGKARAARPRFLLFDSRPCVGPALALRHLRRGAAGLPRLHALGKARAAGPGRAALCWGPRSLRGTCANALPAGPTCMHALAKARAAKLLMRVLVSGRASLARATLYVCST
jgi:hypothetical protein